MTQDTPAPRRRRKTPDETLGADLAASVASAGAPPPPLPEVPAAAGAHRRRAPALPEGIEQSAGEVRGDVPATPFGELPAPGQGFDRIVETVFDLPDPMAEYEALEAALRTAPGAFVNEALSAAEDHARRAHRLYVCARVDAERFNRDAATIEGAMRVQAVAELTSEKDAGTMKKQITEADIAARVATLYPDEVADLSDRRIRVRKMVEHMENFAALWKSRCVSLRSLLESRRLPTRTHNPEDTKNTQ